MAETFDARYEYRTCITCGTTHQRIDFRAYLHEAFCAKPEEAWAADLREPRNDYRRGHEVSRNCPCDRCDAWFRSHGDDEEG